MALLLVCFSLLLSATASESPSVRYADLLSGSAFKGLQVNADDYEQQQNVVGFDLVNAGCDDNVCYNLAVYRVQLRSSWEPGNRLYWPTPLWSPFTSDGNLLLRDQHNQTVWQSNTTGMAVERLRLLQTGELQLLNTSRAVVWRSTDEPPQDHLLESQRLPITGKLVSAAGAHDYGQGSYELRVEAHRVALYRTTFGAVEPFKVWPSPTPIAYIQHTNLTLAMFASNGTVIDSLDVTSTSRMTWSNCTDLKPSTLMLSFKGVLSLGCYILWETDRFCEAPRCSPSEVCIESAPGCICPEDMSLGQDERCHSSEVISSDFLQVKDVDHTLSKSVTGIPAVTLDECKQLCLRNASCTGVFYRKSSSTCDIPSVMLMVNVSDAFPGEVSAFVRLSWKNSTSATTVSKPKRAARSRRTLLLTPTLVPPLLLLLLMLLLLCLLRHRRLTLFGRRVDEEDKFCVTPNAPTRYRASEITQMTNKFAKKIGEGGFGCVYYGVLTQHKGTEVAVKCLEGASQGLKQFEAEVLTIGSMDHKNLVKLVGYGVDSTRQQYYLVYEFLPNLSLDEWLFSSDQTRTLDWNKRVTIALDVAKGLSYLHHLCRTPVLHLDIKPQNVLLDAEFRAKICDFGLAKLLQPEQAISGLRTMLRGTPGYIAPEWWLQLKVTEKADVYSFGVLLLELVSGRKTVSVPSGMVAASLLDIKTFEQVMISKAQEKVLDSRLLKDKPNKEQVMGMIKIGLSCTQADPCNRPSMSMVTKMLEEAS